MQQRYYDPIAGRFLSVDPVTTNANTGSFFNRYVYALNNPFVFVDTTGMAPDCSSTGASTCKSTGSLSGGEDVRGSAAAATVRTAASFWTGGYSDQASQSLSDGRRLGAVGYTLAGTVVAVANAVTLGNGSRILGVFGLAAKGITEAKTVLGHFPEYKRLGDSLNARTFNIPEAAWNKMSEAQRWGANQKLLDRMISRGDEIILATPLDKVRPGSYFARELEYMASKGYVPSADGTRLIRP